MPKTCSDERLLRHVGALPYLDSSDANNAAAVRSMHSVLGREDLVTHNYIVVETVALVHRRLPPSASRLLASDLLPLIEIRWIEAEVHAAAMSAFLSAVRRRCRSARR